MNSIHSVQKAIDYIENQLCEPLELQQIADQAYMSVPNLYRAFYALTGHPIKDYIRKRRMSEAANRLRHSDEPVLDIAIQYGFDSYTTFTRMFKKWVGMTPGTYRSSNLYYSFEAVNLSENLCYLEERGLSAQYPDVKVIQLAPMKVAVYRHTASNRERLEEEAFRIMYNTLERQGWDLQRIRFFGSNVELSSREEPYGYDIMVPLAGNWVETDLFRNEVFPGGLYAVSTTQEVTARRVVAMWDRVLSEWLPRSTFDLGDHAYVEEFLTYQGQITRMKLYLPVTKKQEADTIQIVTLDPLTVLTCRCYGPEGAEKADARLLAWLTEYGEFNKSDLRLLMSYSYGLEPDEDYWYELSVSGSFEYSPAIDDSALYTRVIGGGRYACLTSKAYGLMTGVLDRLHQWLYTTPEYSLDENRQWFAEYLTDQAGGADLEKAALVRCYIPVSCIDDDSPR